jgi:hypothetical protein
VYSNGDETMPETSVLFRGERRDVTYRSDWEFDSVWVEEWGFVDKELHELELTDEETEAIDAELLKHLVDYKGDYE